MKKFLLFVLVLTLGCASNVRFVQIDDTFQPAQKSGKVAFKQGKFQRNHKVVGIIEAELGKKASRAELDALILKKAREIGADGVMMVEYDVERTRYLERHHAVVGRGPWRHHVVRTRPRTAVKKTATALAVVFL